MKKRILSFLLCTIIILSLFSTEMPSYKVGANEDNSEFYIPFLGDASGDGRVSVADVLIIRKFVAGMITDKMLIEGNADLNCDGRVAIQDILIIRKYIADIIDISNDLFSVMTYNVGLWYNGSGQLTPTEEYNKYLSINEAILDTYKPDILCLQEYCDELAPGKSAVDNLLGSRYKNIISDKCTSNPYNYIGKAICSNNTIIDAYNSNYEPGATADSPNYEKAYVKINGKMLCIISAHLSAHPYYALVVQLPALIKAVENEEYFIICIDSNINVSEGSYYKDIVSFFNKFSIDCNICNGGTKGLFYTYPSNNLAIDNIITSSNIKVNSVFVDKHKESLLTSKDDRDHYPLIAYFIFD